MNEIQENKLKLYRLIEQLVRKHEENEAKVKEAADKIHRDFESSKPSIGPANDLLRFFYILDQQYKKDPDDTRKKAREDVLQYIDQFRQVDVEEEEEEAETEAEITNDNDDDAQQPQQSIDVPQQRPTIPLNLTQPSILSASSQSLQQQPSVPVLTPSSSSSSSSNVPTTSSQATNEISTIQTTYLSPVTDPAHITKTILESYEKLLIEVKQYKDQYENTPIERKKQLAAPIRTILNKLREDLLPTLTNDLFSYLRVQQQMINNQSTCILNNTERLLCYSLISTLVLRQLLGGDLNDVKTRVLLPLIGKLSSDPQHKEFKIIFLDCLHKKCPYTVPLYPQRKPNMSDSEYKKSMGYEEKKEGNISRLETEDEFLNRMSGFIRLFWKLPVNRIPPFHNDLSFGWQWCAAVLNLPPRPNLTTLLLRVFLDEAGAMMMEAYPKLQEFPKILRTIQAKLPEIGKDTSPSELTRLKTALQNLQKINQ
ncbi:hypothetical protein I4U23_025554 [Adineta vaga]|nr:hypothetical protein I4U23_025554 [Adineta vaga]